MEITAIERERPAAMSLGASNDHCVGEPQRKVGIAMDELLDASEVPLSTVKRVGARLQISEQRVKRGD